MQDAFTHLNWTAVVVVPVSTFMIGGVWFLLFKKQWMAVNNSTKDYLQQRKLQLAFFLCFLFIFIMVFNLAMFIGAAADISFGMVASFLTGFGCVFFSLAIIALFERLSLKYVLINRGYLIIAFTVIETIIVA